MRALLTQYFASAAAPEIVAAYLFGSHARGNAHADSDVDVAVLFDRHLLPSRAARSGRADRLASQLIDVTHCNAIDVIVLNDAPPELAVVAIDAGALLTAPSEESVRTFTRDVRLRLADLRPFLDRARRATLDALVR